jgi:short-subunit dehydrogenase
MKQSILILGATSAIASAAANIWAAQGYTLFLAGRDEEELKRIATHLRIRYNAQIEHGLFLAENFASHANFWQNVLTKLGHIDGILVAVGDLGKASMPADFSKEQTIINVNFTGIVSILHHCCEYLANKKSGFIIGISSVAGDRGRQKNLIYSAAKGALTFYLQGLRNQLYSSDIHVMTVKPGFIDTKMVFGLPNLFWVASPAYAAHKIIEGLKHKKDIIYVPWFWRYIMLIIKAIPEKIFKRLHL